MRKVLDIFRNIRLVWRLIWDGRIPFFLKLFPILSASYFAFPLDLVRDFIPVVGRFDDIILLTVGLILFVRLAPPQIVQEHREAIWGTKVEESDKVTEGEYKILEEDEVERDEDSTYRDSGHHPLSMLPKLVEVDKGTRKGIGV